MATIETGFSRGTVREASRRASEKEPDLNYDAFRMRAMRGRREDATSTELEALDLCVTVEGERTVEEKTTKRNISKKIVKIRNSKKHEA